MKIAQVIPFFAPAWSYGGPVRVCLNISTELAKRGHKVSVLTTDAYDHTKRIKKLCEVMNGVEVFRFKNVSNYLAKNFNLYLPIGFKKYFKNHVRDYDIVHLHSFYTYQNVICCKYCRENKIPYAIHLHESPVADKKFGKTFIKKIFIALWGRQILENSAKVLVLTTKEKNIVTDAYPKIIDKIAIIPNTITFKNPPGVDRKALRAKYMFSEDHKILLSLSRLSNLKRIDKIIIALKNILEYDSNFRLIVAGPDENSNLSKLRKLAKTLSIEDKILFTGPVVGKNKEDLYQLADLYILLSDYESFSVTTLEALSYGLPTVLSNNIGVSDDLKPFKVAVVVRTSSTAQIVESILHAYQERHSLKMNTRKALELFSLNEVSNKLETIYNQIK